MIGPSDLWAAGDQFLLEVDPLTFVQKIYNVEQVVFLKIWGNLSGRSYETGGKD
mgnify:CR=1 FL=1